jgi:hypothetical protein
VERLQTTLAPGAGGDGWFYCSHSYNQQMPRSAFCGKTPVQAMKDWHKVKPEMFRKQPCHLSACDT